MRTRRRTSRSSTRSSASCSTARCSSPTWGWRRLSVFRIVGIICVGILREPLTHRNDLPTLIRKCFENGINLRELFKTEDKFKQGLIERDRLYQILENLPIGYSPQDIYEIFRDSAIFDAHGNADYTIVLQHGVYTILEKLRLQREMQSQRGSAQNSVHSTRKSFVSSFIDSTFPLWYSVRRNCV